MKNLRKIWRRVLEILRIKESEKKIILRRLKKYCDGIGD
jgi:hypothetical protein